MKKLLSVVLCILLCSMAMQAMNKGSATKLRGRIYVLSVFVSTGEWSGAEKNKLFEEVKQAEAWLKKQAARYGSSISFVNGNYGLSNTVRVNQLPNDAETGDRWSHNVRNVMNAVGWSNANDFVDWAKQNEKVDHVVLLVFCNGKGRSYALPYVENSDRSFLEGAILFKESTRGSVTRASTIAHEMLHLFGAWDLYKEDDRPQKMQDKVNSEYPNEIMVTTHQDIGKYNMSELTAWRVGIAPYKTNFIKYSAYQKQLLRMPVSPCFLE